MRAFAVMCLAILFTAQPAGASPSRLLIKNVRLVQIDKDGPAAKADILVIGSRIARIGSNLGASRGTKIIDGAGRYAIPGLWDMHAHLAATNSIGRKPEDYVGHGVLGVRDMGGRLADLKALKTSIARGRTGPAMVIAGPTLNGIQPAPWHRVIADRASARQTVRDLKGSGVDFIKVHRATSREAFLGAIEEAKRQRLAVSGHVPLALKWDEAARAGMHSIEHAVTIVENETTDQNSRPQIRDAVIRLQGPYGARLFEEMARQGTYFDPTLVFYAQGIEKVEPKLAAERRLLLDQVKKLVLLAHRMNVRLLVGTDITEKPGQFVAEEVELLVAAGVPARIALQAATANAARAAGHPALASIAVGAPASFVLLAKDPLALLSTLRSPSAVVHKGRWIGGQQLEELRSSKSAAE